MVANPLPLGFAVLRQAIPSTPSTCPTRAKALESVCNGNVLFPRLANLFALVYDPSKAKAQPKKPTKMGSIEIGIYL